MLIDEVLTTNPHLATAERVASVAGGLLLASAATQPRPNPVLSLLAITIGSYLTYRGATGYCPIKAALSHKASPAIADGSDI